jgi:hypothetical protein
VYPKRGEGRDSSQSSKRYQHAGFLVKKQLRSDSSLV